MYVLKTELYKLSFFLLQGFQILVEREWLEFGHKFADRCGQTEDINENCPVFLQFLDILHNIIKQFPTAFEFSINYLVSVCMYSSEVS